MNTYMVGSGYAPFEGACWFSRLWIDNVMKQSGVTSLTILSVGGERPDVPEMRGLNVIRLENNLGHVHQLIGKQFPAKPHAFCGWSASVLALALIAYNDEKDFVYVEQDCLLFGECIEQMYQELGNSMMIFGRKMQGPPWMPCAQSLFLIRHEWIPAFVHYYLGMGDDRGEHRLPEHKFMALLQRHQKAVRQFSFGYDRERPFNINDSVWYAQKFTSEELKSLRAHGLISFDGLPDAPLLSSQA